MLKLLGGALLTGSAAWLGAGAAWAMARRVRALEAWDAALERMESELSFRLSAMPELAERLGRWAAEPARGAFLRLEKELDRLGERPFEELWRAALEGQSEVLDGEELELLCSLGTVLGRYGWEDQCRSLESVRRSLAGRARREREELRRRGRAYTTLGAALGAFLTILLL